MRREIILLRMEQAILAFESEELRQKWVASPIHQKVWPTIENTLKHKNYRTVLLIRQDTHKPFHLDVFKDGNALFSIRYVSYKTNLAFDPALFKPPTGLTITEAKVNNTK